MDLDGFLDSSLHVHASPDRYASMVGLDTVELDAVAAGARGSVPFSCDDVLAAYHRDGVVHLPGHLPAEAVLSVQRAVQKLVSDHGGGAMEDVVFYPERLARETDFFIDWLDSTGHAHLFPLFVALRPLVDCMFGAGGGVLSYLILRGKVPNEDRQHISWHQDAEYQTQAFTRAWTPHQGLPEIEAHAARALTVHVPLTPQTRKNGALMYARGSHGAFHPDGWPSLWRETADLPQGRSAFRAEELDNLETFETEVGDILAHNILVHHGSHLNRAQMVRWHVEVLVRAGDLPNHWGYHEPRVPNDGSLPSLLQWLQDCAIFQQEYLASFEIERPADAK